MVVSCCFDVKTVAVNRPGEKSSLGVFLDYCTFVY